MEKIECKKDWIVDGLLVFKKGKKYNITRKERGIRANGVMITPNKRLGKNYWFWSESDFFDVDSLFEIPVL